MSDYYDVVTDATDVDTCVNCLHPVDEHDNTGCTHTGGVITGMWSICPCSANPQPYDPADQ
jgi:hypothetical protein